MRSRITVLVFVLALLIVGVPASAPAASSVNASANPTAGTNLLGRGRLAGRVLAMAEAGSRLFLAGEFTGIRSSAADGGIFDGITGGAVPGFPRLGDGQIKAAAADGSGGFYVSGTFTMVEGHARPGVAHFQADGHLSRWSPDVAPPGTVKALARSAAGTVYLGGEFTSVAGQDRPGVALVDGTSGSVHTGFAPTLGPTVVRTIALSPDESRLYVGGRVDPGGGAARRGLAALRSATGATEPWDPDVVGRVDTVAVAPADGRVYIGGDFDRVAGAPRLHLARLDPVSGAPDTWGEGADGPVAALALSTDGSRVFAGGEFTSLGGLRRRHLGALDSATGAVLAAWDPGADGPVAALAVAADGSLLYAGGVFAHLGDTGRPGLGALDPASGAVSGAWVPDSGGTVDALTPSGSLVLAGGRFDSVVERPRAYLAALTVAGGTLDSGFPTQTDGPVRALALSGDGSRLFLGGDFGAVDGIPRPVVALVDASTGAVDPGFVPAVPNGPVRALALSPDGHRLYIGGAFDSVATPDGPVPRPAHVAALDAATGALVPEWSPPPDRGGAFTGQTGRPTDGVVAVVNTLTVSADGDRVYAGGTFVDLGGRSGLVSLSAADGTLSPWQPEMDRPVNSIFESSVDGGTIYVATGGFGGEIQAFDPAGTAAPVWYRHFDGDATAVVASAGTVYVAGHYDYVCERCGSVGGPGDDFRRHLAAFDAATGALDPWAPVANTKTGPYCAAVGTSHLYIGGEFTRINDLPQPGLAQFAGTP
ncbi:MAG: PQQ-binding-like beta-propeller repeat protein [Actinomycetota bacterium]|nr:PQQ-binding-like beta-propeller repeat protein [Actinomycetota bacterium]